MVNETSHMLHQEEYRFQIALLIGLILGAHLHDEFDQKDSEDWKYRMASLSRYYGTNKHKLWRAQEFLVVFT